MSRFIIYLYVLPCCAAAALGFMDWQTKGFGFWGIMAIAFSVLAIAVLALPFLPIWGART